MEKACSPLSTSVRFCFLIRTHPHEDFKPEQVVATIPPSMKHNPALTASQNSNPAFETRLPAREPFLPPTHLRIIAGTEMHRNTALKDGSSELFGNATRHYRMTARGISAPAITLEPLAAAELEGAIRLACVDAEVTVMYGIPTPANGATFKVTRRADLFPGGNVEILEPGDYVAGDTIACDTHRRVYLELHHGSHTSIAVVGLFMSGRLPTCVDWRVITSPVKVEQLP
jgi:hypothetical protein